MMGLVVLLFFLFFFNRGEGAKLHFLYRVLHLSALVHRVTGWLTCLPGLSLIHGRILDRSSSYKLQAPQLDKARLAGRRIIYFLGRVGFRFYRGVGNGGGGGGVANIIHFLYKVLGKRSMQK